MGGKVKEVQFTLLTTHHHSTLKPPIQPSFDPHPMFIQYGGWGKLRGGVRRGNPSGFNHYHSSEQERWGRDGGGGLCEWRLKRKIKKMCSAAMK